MSFLAHLLALIHALSTDRARLALENVALKQQILVLKGTKRACINDSDRAFWVLMRRMLKDWEQALFVLKPDTVIRWHRKGFRSFWRWKSMSRLGRPPIDRKLIYLIQRLSPDNPLWGAPRIQKELALLGHDVCEATVTQSRVRHRNPSGT